MTGSTAPSEFLRTLPSLEMEAFTNQLFATLIHSCRFKRQQPGLGQYSIGRVGQYSIGANILCEFVHHRWAFQLLSVGTGMRQTKKGIRWY